MQSNQRQGNADQVLKDIEKATEGGEAKPIENPEGFCPTSAIMGPNVPCVTVVHNP